MAQRSRVEQKLLWGSRFLYKQRVRIRAVVVGAAIGSLV